MILYPIGNELTLALLLGTVAAWWLCGTIKYFIAVAGWMEDSWGAVVGNFVFDLLLWPMVARRLAAVERMRPRRENHDRS